MLKTMKEIADELGVDKQKVYRFIKRNNISEAQQKRNSVKHYDEAAEMRIKQGLLEETASDEENIKCIGEVHSETVGDTDSETAFAILQRELDIKNEQIRELNARLAEVSAALVSAQQSVQAAQVLHAGTIQQQLADGEGNPSEYSREQEENIEEKKGWFSRLFGRF